MFKTLLLKYCSEELSDLYRVVLLPEINYEWLSLLRSEHRRRKTGTGELGGSRVQLSARREPVGKTKLIR